MSGPGLDLDHDITPGEWKHDGDGQRVTIPVRGTIMITGYVEIRMKK